MPELYELLRYYIPGSLCLIYLVCLVIVNVDAEVFLSLQNTALLPLAVSGFAISPIIGYVVYSFYDWLLYNPKIAKSKKRAALNLLETWAKNTSFEKRIEVWEMKKEFIDFVLYSNERDPKFRVEKEINVTLRGFWSHINARLVSSLFVPCASFLLFLALWFASTGLRLPVLGIPVCWNSFSVVKTVGAILVIAFFSVLIGLPARKTIREAFALEEYIFLAKRKFILKYMGFARATSAQAG